MNKIRTVQHRRLIRARITALGVLVTAIFTCGLIYGINPGRAQERFLDIREVASKNGVTAWLVEDHSLPIIALTFSFKGAGAIHDPADKQGLARLVSNTMDEGAADLDGQAFQKTLADNSISLSFNASRDDYGGTLKTLSRRKDLAFDLLRKAVTAPRFDDEAVERMRNANLARLRSSMSEPDWMAARLINDIAFTGHPYALNSGGTVTTLQAITPDDMKTFAKTRLARSNLLVTAVGDITAEELAARLNAVFGALPATASLPAPADITVQNGGQIALYEQDIPQAIIEIMQPGIARTHPDYHAFQIMNFIFGGSGFGSRLTEEVREKRGLTYGIYSSIYLLDHLKGFAISTSTENANAGEVLRIIREEMEKIRTTPVTAEDMADAQSYITGSMPLSLSSTEAIAGLLLSMRLDDLPIDYLDTFKDKIMAVKAEDVQRVAQEVLKPDALTIAIVGRPEGVTATRKVEKLPNVE